MINHNSDKLKMKSNPGDGIKSGYTKPYHTFERQIVRFSLDPGTCLPLAKNPLFENAKTLDLLTFFSSFSILYLRETWFSENKCLPFEASGIIFSVGLDSEQSNFVKGLFATQIFLG